jgi:hypothetical protein
VVFVELPVQMLTWRPYHDPYIHKNRKSAFPWIAKSI